MKIDSSVIELRDEVVSIRRKLHSFPEESLMEYKTTAFITEMLDELGIVWEPGVSGTGAIALIKGNPGIETIAFRADIDALSLEEQTGVPYCSTRKGYMHACGHDGHTAILLGFAKLLMKHRNELKSNVMLIFQPAEEGPGGAKAIADSGVFERYNTRCIFGLHIYPELEEGKIGCRPGPMMAQTGEFDLHIAGSSSHGAMPHKGRDAMLAAASIVLSLNTIISRNIDPIEPSVVSAGRLVCGERRNVIAGEAVLEGIIRSFNDATYKRLRNRVEEIAHSVAEAFECNVRIDIRDMYPAVVNSEYLYNILTEVVDEESMTLLEPLTISEDFSYYQKKIPGLFIMLGSRNEEMGFTYPLHSGRFNFNEDIMLLGIQLFYNLLKHTVR